MTSRTHKIISNLIYLACFFISHFAFAAEQTYVREYTYQASEADSKISARAIALQEVKRELLNELGTHVVALVKIQSSSDGGNLGKEEIETLSAGVTSVEILEEKWNGVVYVLKAQIKADPEEVLKSLNKMLDADKKQKQISRLDGELTKVRTENIQIAESLTRTKQEATAALDEITRLKKKLEERQTDTSLQTLQTAYQQQAEQLSLNELIGSALQYYDKGNYPAAIRLFQKAANQGNANAQYYLGSMYDYGKGVRRDQKRAMYWYQKAAVQGNPSAQVSMGVMYANGFGVTKDYAKAITWYQKAADQGDSGGQHFLGVMYSVGHGVTKDYEKAFEWHQKAAIQGDADSQAHIGFQYKVGRGVPKDYTKAFMWYQKAADQGNSEGQFGLGVMYELGNGVPLDYSKALDWYRKSAAQGNAEAQDTLGQMYEEGHGVSKDYSKALEWYGKAKVNGALMASYHFDNLKKLTKDATKSR